MLIRNNEIDVVVEDELDPYIDQFDKARTRGNKLQACSPFRDEKTPSFAVNLDNGTWIDSGATEDAYSKGNFIKLLSFLQGVTYEETEDYLLEKYRTILDDVDSISLDVQLEQEKTYREITEDDLREYLFRSPYLGNRGITEQVQRAFKIGYDKANKAVTLVWHDKRGKPINIKFRSVKDKRFWYLGDGQPIKQHIYGLHFIHRIKPDRVFIVESETDALYLWSHKIPAIALGSASLSRRQEELLLNSPISELVLCFDRDKAGIRCKYNVIERLSGKIDLWEIKIPSPHKDVNDLPPETLLKVVNSRSRVTPQFL